MSSSAANKIRAAREGERTIGYWIQLDSPVSTERIARQGYDYVALDWQHGLFDYAGMLNGLMAIDAANGPAGLVRVGANDPREIGQALDAGARGVIVPLIDDAEAARSAVRAARYPPAGSRSFGPMRAGLRIGPKPGDADAQTLVLAMIETPAGLENVEAICAVEGLDGVYIGPADLSLALGGAAPGDPAIEAEFENALVRIQTAAKRHGCIAAIHTPNGEAAKRRLDQGFTFVTISGDLNHLGQIAASQLRTARGD